MAKFVRASLRGWRDYLVHPDDINAAIAKLNPAMSVPQMKFSYEALRDQHFIAGDAPNGADLGRFDPARWTSMYQQLLDLKVIQKPFDPALLTPCGSCPRGTKGREPLQNARHANGRKNLTQAAQRVGVSDHDEIESRRACPELVERGRLNLAQDAVLGRCTHEKSRRDD